MNFHKNRFVHWIAAAAIAMSSLAPAVSQAVSVAKDGHGFVMEVCTVDGGKIQVNVKTDGQTDTSDPMKSCPYCNLIKTTTPASRSRSNPMDMLKVVMVGATVGVLGGVGITATLEFKQIKSFIQPA